MPITQNARYQQLTTHRKVDGFLTPTGGKICPMKFPPKRAVRRELVGGGGGPRKLFLANRGNVTMGVSVRC